MDNTRFIDIFLRDYGFSPSLDREIILSHELSPEYPIFFFNIPRMMGIALCEELYAAREVLSALPRDAEINDVLRIFFEDNVDWRIEEVQVYFADECKLSPPPLPEGYIMESLHNMKELEELAKSLTLTERMEALPWDTDDFLTGLYSSGTLIGVCGATRFNGYSDIAICIHPQYRRRGLALSMLSHMCRQFTGEMLSYRARMENIPAIRVAEKMGFSPVLTYYGAQLLVEE